MRSWCLQDFIGLVCFESDCLLVHPYFLLLLGADGGLASGAEVVTRMKEVNQVTALRVRKTSLYLLPA